MAHLSRVSKDGTSLEEHNVSSDRLKVCDPDQAHISKTARYGAPQIETERSCCESYFNPERRGTRQVGDPTGTYSFTYDNMNRLTQATTDYSFDSHGAYTVQYGYDAASNRTSMTAPDGSTNSYSYDSLNRLTNLSNSLTGSFGFNYDVLSRRTQLTRPNGVNTNYSYDNLSRLLSVLHQVGSTTIDGASYTYDSAGNRTAKTNYLNSVTAGYSYDPLYQLTQVVQGATTTESYSYDSVGNRLSSLGVSPYVYNSSNQLTATPSATYTYDYNGNTTSKTDSTGTTTYNWNAFNQLTSVVLPGAGGTVSFKYDPFGRRVQKSSASGAVDYLYDDKNWLEEVDNGGNVLARYTQMRTVDEELAMVRSGNTDYYQADGIGSITSLSDGVGVVANTRTYDSFGMLAAANGTVVNPFMYAGRDLDQETGIYDYRARYYDPSSGRFLSEDPAEDDLNLYVYVRNSPTNSTDPFGLYTMKNPRVPWPSAALDALLKCIENRTGVPLVVTSTTEGKHQDPGHSAGTSIDIRPPAGISPTMVFCAAGLCGAAWGLDETGGNTFQFTTGANIHLQLHPPHHPSPRAPNAIPPYCKGRCPFTPLAP